MQDRMTPSPGTPAKNQEVSITLSDGRTFSVCSKGQYRYLVDQARNMIVSRMIDGGEVTEDASANEGVVNERLEHWKEHESKFAPLDWILERMTPEERESWKQQYRFGGICRRPG